jgi:hypothetical protein
VREGVDVPVVSFEMENKRSFLFSADIKVFFLKDTEEKIFFSKDNTQLPTDVNCCIAPLFKQ